MTHQLSRFAVLALTLTAIPCVAQDYCGLLNQPSAVGANPPSRTAEQILKVLSDTAPFNYDSIKLRDARDIALKTQGAAAQNCNINQRWIFYDPDFVEQIRTKGQSDWPKFFVFAHEVAHHVNNDPQDRHRDQELQADRAAAHWLTILGASVQDLVGSVNAIVVNEKQEPDYPSRCDRVSGVILAYNEEAAIINRQGGSKPLYKVDNCMPVAARGGTAPVKPPPFPVEVRSPQPPLAKPTETPTGICRILSSWIAGAPDQDVTYSVDDQQLGTIRLRQGDTSLKYLNFKCSSGAHKYEVLFATPPGQNNVGGPWQCAGSLEVSTSRVFSILGVLDEHNRLACQALSKYK